MSEPDFETPLASDEFFKAGFMADSHTGNESAWTLTRDVAVAMQWAEAEPEFPVTRARLLPTGAAGEGLYTKEQAEAMVALALAADRHARALKLTPAREPVAWVPTTAYGDRYWAWTDDDKARSEERIVQITRIHPENAPWTLAPVYTHPPTPEAGTVTEKMVEAGARVWFGSQHGSSFWGKPDWQGEVDYARSIARRILTAALNRSAT